MKKILITLTLALSTLMAVQAQTTPYYEPPTKNELPQQWCGSGTDFAGGEAGLTAWANDYYAAGKRATVNTKKYLPMCLHLVGNTDGTNQMRPGLALDLICDLNDDYRPHNIRYWLDSIDLKILNSIWNDPPQGNSTWGSTMPTGSRKATDRVNLYFHGGGATTGLCGRYTGNAVGNGSATGLDVVNCFGSCLTRNNTTVTHEMGHYNAMPHTFYGLENNPTSTNNDTTGACRPVAIGPAAGCENYPRSGTGSNCATTGDKFCDTYPDYNPGRWSCDGNGVSCIDTHDRLIPQNRFRIDGKNYMSYADDACADHPFSQMQEDRMHAFIQSQRATLANVARVGDTISAQSVLTTPLEGQSFCTPTGIQLSWNPTPNAVYYILTIGRTASLASNFIVEEVIVRGTSYVSSKLLNNANYYWRVRPYNKVYFCTSAQASAVGSFNTKCVSTDNSIKGLKGVGIVPNPVAEDRFTINVEADEDFDTQINILSLNGQVVRDLGKHHVARGEANLEFNAFDLTNGLYMVQMQTESGVKTVRMVIAR